METHCRRVRHQSRTPVVRTPPACRTPERRTPDLLVGHRSVGLRTLTRDSRRQLWGLSRFCNQTSGGWVAPPRCLIAKSGQPPKLTSGVARESSESYGPVSDKQVRSPTDWCPTNRSGVLRSGVLQTGGVRPTGWSDGQVSDTPVTCLHLPCAGSLSEATSPPEGLRINWYQFHQFKASQCFPPCRCNSSWIPRTTGWQHAVTAHEKNGCLKGMGREGKGRE